MIEGKLLDDIGQQILKILQKQARISFSELGRIVGLSSPAVAERVRSMEAADYITGYRTVLDQGKIGFPIVVFINVELDGEKIQEANEVFGQIPEVIDMYHLSGEYGFMLKVAAGSMKHLETVINQVNVWGKTSTSVVLSSSIPPRGLEKFTA
jgi:Lrp/AsnC family leucine-responsive transcriptional regulator